MTVTVLKSVTTLPPARREAVRPPCARCGNPRTEPVQTMRLCTSDADTWFRCEECEHVFSTSRHAGDD